MNNQERIERGCKTFDFYQSLQGTDPDAPQDIIADLAHFLHSEGLSVTMIGEVLTSGLSHFSAEIED